jgi:hypothetical protein
MAEYSRWSNRHDLARPGLGSAVQGILETAGKSYWHQYVSSFSYIFVEDWKLTMSIDWVFLSMDISGALLSLFALGTSDVGPKKVSGDGDVCPEC